jgi:type I restriction enzyme, S subunit
MREARLGEVVASMKNGMYKPASEYADDGVPCLRMYNIESGAIVWRDIKRMRVSGQELVEYGLQEGDLLVNRVNSRELVGKAACIPSGLERSVFESKNIRVRLDTGKVLPKFINYQLFARGSRHFTNNAQQVVGMASISQGQLADFPIVVTELDEQQRIVAEIEKQFSRLDKAIANLQRAKAGLERYKSAVLQAAVEGRLGVSVASAGKLHDQTFGDGGALCRRLLSQRRAEWAGKTAYKEASQPRAEHLPLLPKGWGVVSLEAVTSPNRVICYGILMPKENVPDGVLYVKVRDMRNDVIDVPALQRTSRNIASKYARASLREGDLLLSIRGTYGRVAEVPAALEGGNITQDTARLAVSPLLSSRFLAVYLRSETAQRYFKNVARGVAVKGVNIGDLRPMPVPVPPIAEQERIADEVDRHLSVIREVAVEVDANLRRARSLRQAILAKQFSAG